MTTPTEKKPLPLKIIAFIALAVAALALLFVLLATIGDDVPNNLPAATETSTGE